MQYTIAIIAKVKHYFGIFLRVDFSAMEEQKRQGATLLLTMDATNHVEQAQKIRHNVGSKTTYVLALNLNFDKFHVLRHQEKGSTLLLALSHY